MSRYDQTETTFLEDDQFFVIEPFAGAPPQRIKSLRVSRAERIDLIAHDYDGDDRRWDRVMALNPDYLSPDDIPDGTRIRVPDPT